MKSYRLFGDAFSEYYFDRVLFADSSFVSYLRADTEMIRDARRIVRDGRKTLALRERADATDRQLFRPLATILGWTIADGEPESVATVHGEERGGVVLSLPDGSVWARVFCAAPAADFEATPHGGHRRFALIPTIARVLDATNTPYAIALNRQELRIVRRSEGGAVSSIVFSLDALSSADAESDTGWRLLFGLLHANALATPMVLDRVVDAGRREMVGVGTALGRQVQEAVAIFLRGLYSVEENRARLPGAGDEAALAALFAESLRILYRCLFALFAEARGLVPVDLPIYRESYALTGAAAAPVLGSAARLRALFTLLRRGADLGNGERIPAFGGALFARAAAPLVESLRWDDASVAAMLQKLTRIRVKRGDGFMPVSYRELDEERLGSIYEGLLELRLSLADVPMDRIGVQGRELVVDPRLLRELAGYDVREGVAELGLPVLADVDEQAADDEEFAGSVEVDDVDIDDESDDAAEEEPPEDSAEPVTKRRREVLRLETIPAGTPYLASSSGRKETASYYTARDLVDFLVRETIDPQAEHAEPAAILRLRVVDAAMGSGHFLIGAMRRLADHLLAAYRRVAERESEAGRDGLAALPTYVQAVWDDDRELLALCRQLVAVHCIYGVDKNPLAVDLARVALWLATAASNHQLSFLDHRLRCGDGLLGLPVDQVIALPRPAAKKKRGGSAQIAMLTIDGTLVDEMVLEGAVQRSLVRAFTVMRGFLQIVDDEREPFELKRQKADAVRASLEPLITLHNARVGVLFYPDEDHKDAVLSLLADFSSYGYIREERHHSLHESIDIGRAEQAFCWELEFPEVFFAQGDDGGVTRRIDAGFDIVLGNPPWDKLRIDKRQYYARFDPLNFLFEGRTAKKRFKLVDSVIPFAKTKYDNAVRAYKCYSAVVTGLEFFKNQTTGPSGKRLRTHHDNYKLFFEKATRIARSGALLGLVLPGAFTSSAGASGLRGQLLNEGTVKSICGFENRKKLFAIDSRFKFLTLVFSSSGKTVHFEARFWQHSTSCLKPAKFQGLTLRSSDIKEIDPANLVFTEFRSEKDVEIVRALARAWPPFAKQDSDWPVNFGSDIGLSKASRHFRTRHELEQKGARFADVFKTDDDLYIPVYEGRMIQHFDANAKGWISGDGRSAVWGEHGFPKPLLQPHHWIRKGALEESVTSTGRRFYWCEVTGATNERSAMGTVVSRDCVAGNSLVRLTMGEGLQSEIRLATVSAVFNSFVFDWFVRLRIGDHLSFSYVAAVPFARKLNVANLSEIVESLTDEKQGSYAGRADVRAYLDASVAVSYQLSYYDFAHIIDAFPLLDRGEPPLPGETASTITRDLALAAYCQESGEHNPEHADRVRAARALGALGYVATPLRLQLPNAVRRPRS